MNARTALVVWLAGIGLLAAAACGGGTPKPTSAPGTPTPTVTSVPSPTATPAPEGTPISIQLNAPAAPLAGSVLFTVTGCFQCDGPDETLQRHDVGTTGALTTRTLLRSGEGILSGWTIGGLGAVPDASMLWATACRTTYCGGLGNSHPKDTWAIFWSFDKGASWSVAFQDDATEFASVTAAADGRLIVETVAPGGPPATFRYTVVDRAGKTEIHAPQSAGQFPEPQLLNRGVVVWVSSPDLSGTRVRLFRDDGTELALASNGATTIVSDGVFQTPGDRLFVGGLDRSTALYGFDLYTNPGGPLVSRYQLAGGYRFVPLSDRFVLANVTGDLIGLQDVGTSYPVLIDVDHVIATPFVADVFTEQRGRNRFIAFVPAP